MPEQGFRFYPVPTPGFEEALAEPLGVVPVEPSTAPLPRYGFPLLSAKWEPPNLRLNPN